jgi:hypothetical protein
LPRWLPSPLLGGAGFVVHESEPAWVGSAAPLSEIEKISVYRAHELVSTTDLPLGGEAANCTADGPS